MELTDREKAFMDALSSIGKRNISLEEIADSLGISYKYLRRRRCDIPRKYGYFTFEGFLCDYVAEKTREEMKKEV